MSPYREIFSTSWCRQVSELWNVRQNEGSTVKDSSDFVLNVNDRKYSVWFHWDAAGRLSLPVGTASGETPELSAQEKTWLRILSSQVDPVQAVISGEVEYSGSGPYLLERLDLLRDLVKIARSIRGDLC
jgi:putative sterol carrier protein